MILGSKGQGSGAQGQNFNTEISVGTLNIFGTVKDRHFTFGTHTEHRY